jgi:hypothetical protein
MDGRPHGQTVLRNLLDGPILVGLPEGDAVPREAQPNPWGVLAGSCPQSWRPQFARVGTSSACGCGRWTV